MLRVDEVVAEIMENPTVEAEEGLHRQKLFLGEGGGSRDDGSNNFAEACHHDDEIPCWDDM